MGQTRTHRSQARVRKTVAVVAGVGLAWGALLRGVVWYPAAVVLVAVSSLVVAATFFLPTRPTIERHSGLILIGASLLIGALGLLALLMADQRRYGGSHLMSSLLVAGVFLAGAIATVLRSRRP